MGKIHLIHENYCVSDSYTEASEFIRSDGGLDGKNNPIIAIVDGKFPENWQEQVDNTQKIVFWLIGKSEREKIPPK
ncbi:hypothetical protein KBB25_03130 [Candidatus Gracilibacteria bacterium]|nr:hypothetical protein [Candidatus Gracilibacteria bacterium]